MSATEEDLADLIMENHDNIVIVDGLPQNELEEGSNKYIALCNDLEEAATRIAETRVTVHVAQEERTGAYQSKSRHLLGFAFIAFPDRIKADEFRKMWSKDSGSPLLQNYAHRGGGADIQVFSWRAFHEYSQLDEDNMQFDPKTFKSQRNLWWYLEPQVIHRISDLTGQEETKQDKRFNDQYVVRYGEETNIFWNDELRGGRTLVNDGSQHTSKRKTWTRHRVGWSRLGGYLMTYHPQGISLWGGPNFSRLNRLEHSLVDYVDFSPDDQFIVTCNSVGRDKGPQPKLQIYEVQPEVEKGREKTVNINKAAFYQIKEWTMSEVGPVFHQLAALGNKIWPIIKWTKDSRFFCYADSSKKKATKINAIDKISIFERGVADDGVYFSKVDRRSLSVPNVFDYDFSPTHNVLAYTTCLKAKKNTGGGAALILTLLPSKNELKVQQLGFDVIQPHIYWHPNGRFLAVRLIRVVQRQWTSAVGVLVLEANPEMQRTFPFQFSEKLPTIETFNWAPSADMYAVMSKIPRMKGVVDIRVCTVDSNGTSRLHCFWSSRRATEFHWSPDSRRCVIANVDSRGTGDLEFIDLDDPYFTVKARHQGITHVEWDPCGRYFCSSVTTMMGGNMSSFGGSDTGYRIWSYQGDALYQFQMPQFYMFRWRPRPKFPMDEKDQEELEMGLEEYFREFEEHDEEVRLEEMSVVVKRNRATRKRWNEIQRDWEERSRRLRLMREELRGYDTDGDDDNYETTFVDEQVTVEYTEIEIPQEELRRILAGDNSVDFEALAQRADDRQNTSVRPR